jgi:hypothetical protein
MYKLNLMIVISIIVIIMWDILNILESYYYQLLGN